ncbi:MJ1255/VC2487 family glycosyltransferase [Neptunicella marina]|uniref:Glycosyltransferase n=1 Tax=Neptunicella marina TaxID=2125989 RepID=A0A8J6IQX9_9ALTE|nr:MJ1255/VC2487 family glycosyltransferase [Neptunicella marina]MBC3765955.1 glycosyltransferase [Neptunicella marina]
MKIFYGVQGTGNGHITRARVMAAAFAKRDDIQVDYLFSGRAADKYFDMEVFGDFQTRRGLSFVTKKGSIDHWQTFKQASTTQLWKDIKSLDLSGYDLLLNDFEPISAWAAKRQKIPSISISHQAAFTHNVPKEGDNLMNRLLLKYFAPCDINLGVHWHHFGHHLLPPLIDIEPVKDVKTDQYLVYLPFENLTDIEEFLKPISEKRFVCFHPNLDSDYDDENISWRKTSKTGFREELVVSAGVIANAGFELSSECLMLGKKLLLKPLHGQFEQLSNVLTLNELQLCSKMHNLDTDILDKWLHAPSNNKIVFPQDVSPLVDWIKAQKWQDTGDLCKALWDQVIYPEPVQRLLNRYPKLTGSGNAA